ncbi:choice-of-anchor C family protein [Chitinibacteraceae bacterium HSL-7]
MKHTLIAALLLLAGQSHAAAFQNGSFELGTYSGSPSFDTVGTSQTSITGWQVLTHSVDRIYRSFWQASDGNMSIDLNGSYYGGIQQTFDTVAGQRYTVHFDLAGNPAAQTTKSVQISAGDFSQLFQSDSRGRSFTEMGWTTHSFSFVAQGGQTSLTFQSPVGDGNIYWGAALDNVSVAPVPEPETYALMGLGLVGLMAARRRRA